MRAFAEAANDDKSNIGKYPADYTAFEVGDWSDLGCIFNLHPTPISLGLALEFVEAHKAQLAKHQPPAGMVPTI